MRGSSPWAVTGLVLLMMEAVTSFCPAQAPDTVRWVDFHSPKDQDIVVWVTRALDDEKWTAIREIAVQYDAALVITSLRDNPQSAANNDTFAVWTVSLTNHARDPIIKGANLRLFDWMLFAVGSPRELGVLYDDCSECQATTFFTAFYYDLRQHSWAARWMSGSQGIPVWSTSSPPGVTQTRVYAAMADPNGREMIGTWDHLDYGKQAPVQDFLYRYDLDPNDGAERAQALLGKDADAMKQRLCRTQDAVVGLARGQDSQLCQDAQKPHWERKPVTTPPVNNRGQSLPPGARR